jgi:transposase, IS5 family
MERMLRIDFLQHWFNLSDPVAEKSLYDSRAMHRFAGIDVGREPVPEQTTICKPRHLLQAHNLGEQSFVLIQQYLLENCLRISRRTIVDAAINNAPSSTKSKKGERDPDIHQTKKGNQWYFGMKSYVGVGSQTKLIQSVVATGANVHDSQVLEDLLHGDESRVWGDSTYSGQGDAIHHCAPQASDFRQHKGHRHQPLAEQQRACNRSKSKVRAKVGIRSCC